LKRLAVLAIAVPACGMDLGAPAEWIPTDTIEGRMAVESGTAPPLRSAMPQSGDRIRVVTYNIDMGAEPERVAAELHANAALAQADVWLLQEEEFYPGELTTRASRLAAGLGMGWLYVPSKEKGDGTHGLAIVSRFPIENADMMTLPITENWSRRIAVRADIVIGDTRLPVVDLHLETRINITDRILHIRPAVIDLPEQVIVGGDVNTNPFLWDDDFPIVPTGQVASTDQAPLLDGYMRGLGFATPAADVGWTEAHLGVQSRLDAIFPRGLVTTDATVEREITASDHLPVWVDVTLP
jgi:endonuclease/exonuclease/phosphatase family metal-dependent hydrolase